MRLKAFSVANYRSITGAYNLSLSDYTVLVGPNNEGKSNILRAVGLGLRLLSRGRALVAGQRVRSKVRYRDMESFDYQWKRDFPVSLQDQHPEDRTVLHFTFHLNPDDYRDFREKVGSNLQTDLKVKLGLGAEDAEFDVLLQGKAKKLLKERRQLIAEFIGSKILVQYIPATRTAEIAHEVVNELLEAEFASIEEQEEYKKLVKQIDDLQRPIRERVSREIAGTMADFITNLRTVSLQPDEYYLRHALRTSARLMIDDGVLTELTYKGDGIKSLVAISLLRHSSQGALGSRNLILAVEEPEIHLHPNAIHRLRQVLSEISHENQVIITTHSPVLVERSDIGSNIIVETGMARRATRIRDIRESLGVELSDNLTGAYLALLVEGDEDARMLRRWLSSMSPKIKAAFANGSAVIEGIGGGSKLPFKASVFKGLLCNVYAFLDNDQAGRDAAAKVVAKGIISTSEYTLCACPGMKDSELEDVIDPTVYHQPILEMFGVNVDTKEMRSTKAKWSDRMGEAFVKAGKLWREEEKAMAKRVIADLVEKTGVAAIKEERKNCIEQLSEGLERKLSAYGAIRD